MSLDYIQYVRLEGKINMYLKRVGDRTIIEAILISGISIALILQLDLTIEIVWESLAGFLIPR